MEVYLNEITGWDDAILSLFYSKRNVDREFEEKVRIARDSNTKTVWSGNGPRGALRKNLDPEFEKWLTILFKICPHHITLGKFIDLSFTVYGLHRAGQDDWDSHAKRFDNRIIRSSTRLADFQSGEMSEYYEGKIIPTDVALAAMGITTPDELEYEGKTYVRAVNGYILKGMEDNKDVKRGLYMLSIPSNFIFRINLTEFAHVYKERNGSGTANPEVKECCERCADMLYEASHGFISPDLLMKIKN